MGKEGPCYHCGIASTPLWRNGPPDKPVLCNACGSRWRTKGTLANYTPLHARIDNFDMLPSKVSIAKSTPSKTKDQKLSKRKWLDDEEEFRELRSNRQCHTLKVIDEDSSNKSSSGSAVSYSESCARAQFIDGDSSDIVGSAQSNIWEPLIPSRKRTCIKHANTSSSIQKLTKDLYGILCEQQSSDLSPAVEEELLFEVESPIVSFEFGTGGVLIKHLNLSQGREEESEASSISVDSCKTNIINGVHPSLAISPNIGSKKVDVSRIPFEINYTRCSPQDHVKREIFPHDKFHILRSRNSPLSCIDLKDIICFEAFGKQLTCLEQKQLMKYLPSVDVANDQSLLVMFKSTQLERAVYNFQQLLLEGVFDLSFLGTKIDDCRVLKRLVLLNLKSSKWIERYKFLKDIKSRVMGEKNVVEKPGLVSNLKLNMRSYNGQHANLSESKCVKQNPEGLTKGSNRDFSSLKSHKTNNTESSMDSGQFTADQDLLLDAPSDESVLQAELIDSHSLKSANISNLVQQPCTGKQ